MIGAGAGASGAGAVLTLVIALAGLFFPASFASFYFLTVADAAAVVSEVVFA